MLGLWFLRCLLEQQENEPFTSPTMDKHPSVAFISLCSNCEQVKHCLNTLPIEFRNAQEWNICLNAEYLASRKNTLCKLTYVDNLSVL